MNFFTYLANEWVDMTGKWMAVYSDGNYSYAILWQYFLCWPCLTRASTDESVQWSHGRGNRSGGCRTSNLTNKNFMYTLYGEVTSQKLWSRYDRHLEGITRYNAST